MALQTFVGSWPLFQFLDLLNSRKDSLDGGLARRKAATCTQDSTHTEFNAQTSMPQVGFEPTIPVFERAKTVHALDRAVTVMGTREIYRHKNDTSMSGVAVKLLTLLLRILEVLSSDLGPKAVYRY
jgi:hypothetical protein